MASAITPDEVERKLAQLAVSPGPHDIDDVLESAGRLLMMLESRFSEGKASWPMHRQARVNQSIHQAFEAVNSAVLTLAIDNDVEETAQRLWEALPLIRRAWVVQMLKVV